MMEEFEDLKEANSKNEASLSKLFDMGYIDCDGKPLH
jgi:hypothetical protein